MAVLRRPARPFSFSQHQRAHNQLPGDRLDEVLNNIIEAVISTQEALTEVRRDDGQLLAESVRKEQLAGDLLVEITKSFDEKTDVMLRHAVAAVARVQIDRQDVELRADDAERAAIASAQYVSAFSTMAKSAYDDVSRAENAADSAEYSAVASQNSANYSTAQADNAIKAKDEALQWAEYLAGPVVSQYDAPAYIAGSPFPHGLYYQPVEGYGGTGGLWSAKWWAIYAGQIVGPWAFYYLGPWPSPPMPGMRNPNTGQVVPSPIGVGSIYYDTTSKQAMVWDGTQWVPANTPVAGYKAQYVYLATAGQVNFSGPDLNGQTPIVGTAGSDVYVNGVLQVQGASYDYSINSSSNVLTMAMPLPAGSVVQWILVPSKLAANPVKAYGVTLNAAPDGTRTAFTMTYSGGAVNAGTSVELLVSLDGIVQQPGTDYTATGNTLTFAAAPVTGARLWVTWWAP